MFPGGGVDSNDPQFTEFPLPIPAVPIGVHAGPIHGHTGGPELLAESASVALGSLQDFFSPSSGFKPSLYPWHFKTSCSKSVFVVDKTVFLHSTWALFVAELCAKNQKVLSACRDTSFKDME
jgi:hypothetical protein